MLKGYPLTFAEGKEFREAQMREKREAKLREDWIEDKAVELFVVLNILKPSENDVNNVKTFIRGLISVAKGIL